MNERPMRVSLRLDKRNSDKKGKESMFFDILVNGKESNAYLYVFRGSFFDDVDLNRQKRNGKYVRTSILHSRHPFR
jgi:hypothetical protein